MFRPEYLEAETCHPHPRDAATGPPPRIPWQYIASAGPTAASGDARDGPRMRATTGGAEPGAGICCPARIPILPLGQGRRVYPRGRVTYHVAVEGRASTRRVTVEWRSRDSGATTSRCSPCAIVQASPRAA